MTRHKTLITYLVVYSLTLGAILRYLSYLHSHPSWWTIAGLLAIFLLLLAIEPWLSRHSRHYTHLYLVVQIGILIALSAITTIEDFSAIPLMSLALQAMHVFPPRIGFRWIGIFIVGMAVLIVSFGMMFHGMSWGASLPNILIYTTIHLFVGSFMTVIHQLEGAREESQALLTELQHAHEQLLAYTAQAEELAVTAERTRLARELHDSVTQSLHSSTLMAEAGQRLADAGDLERTKHYLIRLGEISQQALKEMRLMVYELRPLALRQVGLVGALQQRLDAVERRAGVDARLIMVGSEAGESQEVELPPAVEEALYGIAQEALNNALKHAQPSSVTMTLRMEDRVELEVADDGSGFDAGRVDGVGGIGLASMQERADRVGGTLTIHSAPGEGTTIKVIIGP